MIVEDMSTFLGLILNVCTVIGGIITVKIIRKRRLQLINLLYRTVGKANEKENIVDFRSYVNHKLNSVPLDSSEISEYSIKRLKKELKPNSSCNQMTFILGDPGSGKSTLMLHLAYWYCRYNTLQKEILSNKGLKSWGILYCRMWNYQSLEELKEKLDDDFEAVFLDGFDEFAVLQDESEEDVLEELLCLLLDKSNVLRKMYISSRKEPFKNNLKKILKKRNLDGHQPLIIDICPFDRKQILSLYKKRGKRGNMYKMWRYLKDNETIFRIPLFIEYADVIIKENSDDVPFSLWQALDLIVKEWIKDEEELWRDRSNVGKDSDGQDEKKYLDRAGECIFETCKKMIETGTYSFSSEGMEDIFSVFNESGFKSKRLKSDFSPRQLIRKKNEKEYEFIHSLFFEYFVARFLISLEGVVFEQKKLLLCDDTSNYNKFYVYGLQKAKMKELKMISDNDKNAPLLPLIKHSIDEYVAYAVNKSDIDTVEELQDLISANYIFLNEKAEITVYGILWLFPLAEEIKWKSYQLSLLEITDLMQDGRLSLTDGRLKSLSDLLYFEPFKNLDIRNNNLMDIEWMKRYHSLDYLCLYGNRLKSFAPLDNIEISKLEVSVWNERNLEELQSLSIGSCHIDLPEVSSLYIKLEQLQKSRVDWKLAFPPEISVFRKCYNGLPCGIHMNRILAAAFRLTVASFCTEKHFEVAAYELGKEAGESFYLGKRYVESLEIFKQLESAAEKAEDVEEKILMKIRGWRGQVLAKTGEYGRAIPLLEAACGKQWEDDADNETKIMWFWLLKSLTEEKREINVEDYGINNIFEVLFLWGKTLKENGQYNEAEKVLGVLFQKQCELIGEKDEKTLNTQHWLGAIFYDDKQYEEAEMELKECWQRRIEVLGEEHKDSLSTQFWLGMTLEKEKKNEEAEKMLRDCYEKRKEVLAEDDKCTLETQHDVGVMLYNHGRYEEAAKVFNECWQKCKEVLGELDKNSLHAQLWLGATLYQEKKYKEAEKMLRDCYEKRKETLGEKNGDTLTAQSWLGRILNLEKKYEEAEKILYDCYEKEKEILGEEDSETLSTKDSLDTVRKKVGN